jgi:hypothetical protein
MTIRRDLRLLLFVGLTCAFLVFRVTVGNAQTAPAPDFVITSITIGNLDATGNYPLTATVKNQGNAPAVGPILPFVRFWFSTDAVLDTASDTVLPSPPPFISPRQTS